MTIVIPKVTLWGQNLKCVEVDISTYRDGTLAMGLFTLNGDDLATVTVNLAAYDLVPAEGAMFIKDYSEGEGVANALRSVGLIVFTGRREYVGPYGVQVIEVRLAEDNIA